MGVLRKGQGHEEREISENLLKKILLTLFGRGKTRQTKDEITSIPQTNGTYMYNVKYKKMFKHTNKTKHIRLKS